MELAFNNSHNNKNYILVVKHNFSINNNVQPFIGGNQTLQEKIHLLVQVALEKSRIRVTLGPLVHV